MCEETGPVERYPQDLHHSWQQNILDEFRWGSSDDDALETRGIEPDEWLITINILQVGLIGLKRYTAWDTATAAPDATKMNEEVLERWRSEVYFFVWLVGLF